MSKMKSADYAEGYWERAEGSNYRNYADDPGWQVILTVLADFIPPPARLIEVACSKGYFIYHALVRGYEATGCDISEYAISRSVAPDSTVVHNVADPLPWGDADVLCAWEFFEHVPEDEVRLVLNNLIRAVKPGGELWFKTGIIVPFNHPFAGQDDHDHTHVLMRDRDWWEDLFRSAGLRWLPSRELALDEAFAGRDWVGRWFVWEKPET